MTLPWHSLSCNFVGKICEAAWPVKRILVTSNTAKDFQQVQGSPRPHVGKLSSYTVRHTLAGNWSLCSTPGWLMDRLPPCSAVKWDS